jgi:hypothetical protein
VLDLDPGEALILSVEESYQVGKLVEGYRFRDA